MATHTMPISPLRQVHDHNLTTPTDTHRDSTGNRSRPHVIHNDTTDGVLGNDGGPGSASEFRDYGGCYVGGTCTPEDPDGAEDGFSTCTGCNNDVWVGYKNNRGDR